MCNRHLHLEDEIKNNLLENLEKRKFLKIAKTLFLPLSNFLSTFAKQKFYFRVFDFRQKNIVSAPTTSKQFLKISESKLYFCAHFSLSMQKK